MDKTSKKEFQAAKKAAQAALKEQKKKDAAEAKVNKKAGKTKNKSKDQDGTIDTMMDSFDQDVLGIPSFDNEPEPEPAMSAEEQKMQRDVADAADLKQLQKQEDERHDAARKAKEQYEKSALDRGVMTEFDILKSAQQEDKRHADKVKAITKEYKKREREKQKGPADHGIADELHKLADEQAARIRLAREAQEKYEQAARDRGVLSATEEMRLRAVEQFEVLKLEVAWKGWVEKRPDEKLHKDGTEKQSKKKHKWSRRYLVVCDAGDHTGHVCWFKKEEHFLESHTAKAIRDPELRWTFEKASGSAAIHLDTHCDVGHSGTEAHIRDEVDHIRTVHFRVACDESDRMTDNNLAYIHKVVAVVRAVAMRVAVDSSAVVMVDPVGAGNYMAKRINDRGFHVVRVVTNRHAALQSQPETVHAAYTATLFYETTDDAAEQAEIDAQLYRTLRHDLELGADDDHAIVAAIAGSESGVALAAHIGQVLHVRHNNSEYSDVWQNKRMQTDLLRRSDKLIGRLPRQKLCKNGMEAMEFLKKIIPQTPGWAKRPFKVVVKPNASTGGEKVFLCSTIDEVGAACDKINAKRNVMGERNKGALVQDFLEGDEYVFDAVSKDHEHKTISVWKKTPMFENVNGMKMLWSTKRLISIEVLKRESTIDEQYRFNEMMKYHESILDILHIDHGPSHTKIILTDKGPCLLKSSARLHDGGGSWMPLVEACSPTNQLDATIACYLPSKEADAEWANLPRVTQSLIMEGTEINVFVRKVGTITGFPGDETLKGYDSFLSSTWMQNLGEAADLTVDDLTRMGSIVMANQSGAADYESAVQAAIGMNSIVAGQPGLVTLDPKGKPTKRRAPKLAYAVDLAPLDASAE